MSDTKDPIERKPVNSSGKLFLSACLSMFAALITWFVLHSYNPFFAVGSEFNIGMGAPPEQRLALLGEQERVDRWNSMVIFSVGGALLSSVLSMVGSACCSTAKRMLFSLPVGALAGAMSGWAGAYLFSLIIPRDSFPNATNTGLAQATAFGILGLTVGLIVGALTRDLVRVLTAGIVGAMSGAAGGVLFPIITALVMPQQSIVGLLQPSMAGIIWLGLPFVAIGFAIPYFMNKPRVI
ncbi:MAG: hypothetical protein ABL921_13365 [Pirellula sp.]